MTVKSPLCLTSLASLLLTCFLLAEPHALALPVAGVDSDGFSRFLKLAKARVRPKHNPEHQAYRNGRPRVSPDRPKTPDKRPKRTRKIHKLKPAVVVQVACINGRPNANTCVCEPNGTLFRVRANVLACLAPGVRYTAAGLVRPVAGPSVPAQINIKLPDFAEFEILATVAMDTPQTELGALATRHNLTIAGTWPVSFLNRQIVRFRFARPRFIDEVRTELTTEALIQSLQPNYYYGRQGATAGAVTPLSQYALERIDAIRANAITSGAGSLVAVVDSGIDANHPDLAGKVVARLDLLGEVKAAGIVGEINRHGTAIAGLVAAEGLLRGVAPHSKLLDVRVFETRDGEITTVATTFSLLRGIDWAIGQKSNVINLSLAGPRDPLLEEMIAKVTAHHVIVVAAAGNGGEKAAPAYPAAYDQVIAVTATGPDNGAYAQANQGGYIDVAAPGIDLLVTAPDQSYSIETGTSFATAEVTGIVALMLSQRPGMDASQVLAALGGGAVDIGVPGKDPQFGAGLVNAWASLDN